MNIRWFVGSWSGRRTSVVCVVSRLSAVGCWLLTVQLEFLSPCRDCIKFVLCLVVSLFILNLHFSDLIYR